MVVEACKGWWILTASNEGGRDLESGSRTEEPGHQEDPGLAHFSSE